MKKFYLMALTACLAAPLATAQSQATTNKDKDEKELYHLELIDKDFVPVKRNVTMKNVLPQVKKITAPQAVTPDFSKATVATVVPLRVPTMQPYGYRTLHHFSDQRGYVNVGAGSQLNLNVSAGYRIIDEEKFTLGAWLQHNSTWNGKNSSPLVTPPYPQKQKFNDNLLGVDLNKDFTAGTLTAAARFNFDSFNYYGAPAPYVGGIIVAPVAGTQKQSFHNVALGAGWSGNATPGDHTLDYNAGLRMGFAGYGHSADYFYGDIYKFKAPKEFTATLEAGASYNLNNATAVGLDLTGELVSGKNYVCHPTGLFNRNYGMITLSPHFNYEGDNFRAELGLLAHFSVNDGGVKVAPRVNFDVDITRHAGVFVTAGGGKTLNTMATVRQWNRYYDPSELVASSFIPLDLEAGVRFGPLRGFNGRVFAGYGIFKNDPTAVVTPHPWLSRNILERPDLYPDYTMMRVRNDDCRGVKVGAELRYQYRSILDATASFTFIPLDNDPYDGKRHIKNYSTDFDGANLIFNTDIKIRPIKKLALNVGFEYRGNRSVDAFTPLILDDPDAFELYGADAYLYDSVDINSVINLKAGASYQISPLLNVWVQASNLLNKQWDVMPGMGAQRLNVMGGFGLNF